MKIRFAFLFLLFSLFAVPARAQVVVGTCVISSGTGTPEGNKTGKVCDVYIRTNGGASTTLYVKESGTNTTTGWAATATGGTGAPTTATYITQTPDAGLSAEQALSALASGLAYVTTSTGAVTTKAPTDDNVLVGSGSDWVLKAIGDCDAAASALTYDTTTNAFGCNTISGGGGGWTFVTSVTPSASPNQDFTGLSAYNEIMIFMKTVRGSPDFNMVIQVRVSTDNGSTFLNSSGDYVSLSAAMVETNTASMNMHNTSANGFKTGWRIISNFNTTRSKNSWSPQEGGSYLIPTTTALNAVRVLTSTGLDFDTTGTIYIYGR